MLIPRFKHEIKYTHLNDEKKRPAIADHTSVVRKYEDVPNLLQRCSLKITFHKGAVTHTKHLIRAPLCLLILKKLAYWLIESTQMTKPYPREHERGLQRQQREVWVSDLRSNVFTGTPFC